MMLAGLGALPGGRRAAAGERRSTWWGVAEVVPILAQATVRCLAAGGRLLEIGKYDILQDTPLGMRPLLRNVAFEGVDLDRIMHDPANAGEVGALPHGQTFSA
jgi:hypothetical protein